MDSLAGTHGTNLLLTNWPFQSLESSSEQYRENYKPKSITDSLAFAVVTTPSFHINEAHQILADFYMKKGDYYQAFKEYYSKVKFDPFQISDYNNTIHCLTLINDFSLALKLIRQSLELKETFYANYIKGEILFLQGDDNGSIRALNRASTLDKSTKAKLQILNSLHKVYYYSGNKAKADEMLAELKKVNPEYQPVYPSERKNYVFYIPVQVEDQVNKAFDLYRSGNFDQALDEFLNTLNIKETSLANRCIGDILFTRNDSSSIVYYQKAYPDYKNNINFLFNLGILYLQYQQPDEAEGVLEEIKRLNPEFEKIPLLEQKINELKPQPESIIVSFSIILLISIV